MSAPETAHTIGRYVRDHVVSTALLGMAVIAPAAVATLPLYDEHLSSDPRNEGTHIYEEPIFAIDVGVAIFIPLVLASVVFVNEEFNKSLSKTPEV